MHAFSCCSPQLVSEVRNLRSLTQAQAERVLQLEDVARERMAAHLVRMVKEFVSSSFFYRLFQALREENDKLKGQVVVAEALQASVLKVLERSPLTTSQGWFRASLQSCV